MITAEERSELVAYLRQTQHKLNANAPAAFVEQREFRPTPESWSVQEIVEHLAMTEQRFQQIVQHCLSRTIAKEDLSNPIYENEQVKRIIWSRKTKITAPEAISPTGKLTITEGLALFNQYRDENIAFVESTEVDLHAFYWKHPFIGWVDIYQVFMFIGAHLERHLKQIEELREDVFYPSI